MSGMTYTLLHVGDTQTAGLMGVPQAAGDAGMRPVWVGYLGVGDTDGGAEWTAQRLLGTRAHWLA